MRLLIEYFIVLLYCFTARRSYTGGCSRTVIAAAGSSGRGISSAGTPEKPCIWIHAVSVGEVNATRTLVEQMTRQMPDYEIVISSTTDTGRARAKALYKKDYTVFCFPFDFSWTMKRAFKRINPAMILLMELEVWPNMAAIAKKKNIPVVVVNGRLSDRSYPEVSDDSRSLQKRCSARSRWCWRKPTNMPSGLSTWAVSRTRSS